jgi:hypothetical protein
MSGLFRIDRILRYEARRLQEKNINRRKKAIRDSKKMHQPVKKKMTKDGGLLQ